MLSAQGVLDEYFLDTRCMLLEIAAMLDRYDASVERDGGGCDSTSIDSRMHRITNTGYANASRGTPPMDGRASSAYASVCAAEG